MAEYIERETIKKFIEDGLNCPNKEKCFGHDAVEILEEVEFMPAAEVVPVKHSRWKPIIDPYNKIEGWICECGRESKEMSKYCPNCGAKMDLDASEVDSNAESKPSS